MFDTDEEKLIYLAGCALTGTATAPPSDIGKLTRQAYGIAEEMLALITKLKQSPDPSLSSTPSVPAAVRISSTALTAATAPVQASKPVTASPPATQALATPPAAAPPGAIVSKPAGSSTLLKNAAAINAEKTVVVTALAAPTDKTESKSAGAKAALPSNDESKSNDKSVGLAKSEKSTTDKSAAEKSNSEKLTSEQAKSDQPKPEELAKTGDRGWNYTPWGKS